MASDLPHATAAAVTWLLRQVDAADIVSRPAPLQAVVITPAAAVALSDSAVAETRSVEPARAEILPDAGAEGGLVVSLAPPPASGLSPGAGGSPVAAPALPQSLGRDLTAILAARPDGPVEVRLAPLELGRLRLRFWQEGDQVRVLVQAEHRDTLDLLRRNGDALLQEIRSAGFAGADLGFAGWNSGADQEERAEAHASPPRSEPDFRLQALPARSTPISASGLDLRY